MSDSETPWTAVRQASLSSTVSRSFLKFMSTESLMLPNHLILSHPFLLLPSIFPSIRIFSNELAPRIRWSKYRSFNFSIQPLMNIQGWFFSPYIQFSFFKQNHEGQKVCFLFSSFMRPSLQFSGFIFCVVFPKSLALKLLLLCKLVIASRVTCVFKRSHT